MDVLVFNRPVAKTSTAGKRTIGVLTVLAVACALGLAFAAGTMINEGDEGDEEPYPFVATGELVNPLYFAPINGAQANRLISLGETVYVDCYVTTDDGSWYRLTANEGWVSEQDFLPALYTGRGSPSLCPMALR